MTVAQQIAIALLATWIVLVLLCSLRFSYRLDRHRERLDKIDLGILRNHDNRMFAIESKCVEITRMTQERFGMLDTDFASHENTLNGLLERMAKMDDARDLDEKRITLNVQRDEMLNQRLERFAGWIEKVQELNGWVHEFKKWATGQDELHVETKTAISAQSEKLSKAIRVVVKKLDYLDTELQKLDTLIEAFGRRLDVQNERFGQWPEDVRQEVANAYRQMADAIAPTSPVG